MFEGILHKEDENGQIWESENRRWTITKHRIRGKAKWTIRNPHTPYYDNPTVHKNRKVIFNKAAGLPTYVREQFLRMVQDHVTKNTQ